ncbi:DNA (cytosine-5)-methyltransferase 3A [Elusimicrobium posterum]
MAGGRAGLEGARSGLFWEYVRVLEETKPKYFLLENVIPANVQDAKTISKILGVDPVCINSALVSAQNRERLYWTNIPGTEATLFGNVIAQPEDRGIFLKDILEGGFVDREKSYCLDAHYFKTMGNPENMLVGGHARNNRQIVFEPAPITKRSINNIKNENEKSNTLLAGIHKGAQANGMTNIPICVGNVNPSGRGMNGRVFSVEGKICTLTTNKGEGIKVFIDLPDGSYIIRKLTPLECCRLQTYDERCFIVCPDISNTQWYKIFGNGWTVDVIAHIFQGLKRSVKK